MRVMPSMYSVVFCTRVAWVCSLLCKEEGSSPVYLQISRGVIYAYMSMSLFWDGDYVSQFPHVWYYVVVLNMLVRNAIARGLMCFRCLMFSLSGSCELLFSFVLLPLGPELW